MCSLKDELKANKFNIYLDSIFVDSQRVLDSAIENVDSEHIPYYINHRYVYANMPKWDELEIHFEPSDNPIMWYGLLNEIDNDFKLFCIIILVTLDTERSLIPFLFFINLPGYHFVQ